MKMGKTLVVALFVIAAAGLLAPVYAQRVGDQVPITPGWVKIINPELMESRNGEFLYDTDKCVIESRGVGRVVAREGGRTLVQYEVAGPTYAAWCPSRVKFYLTPTK